VKPKKPPPSPFDALRSLKKTLEDEEKRKAEAEGKAGTRRTSAAPAAPAARSSAKSTAAEGAEDEALLLARMFAGVTPLDRSRAPRHRSPDERVDPNRARRAAEQAQREADAVHARLKALVEDTARFEVADDGTHVEGRRVDLPVDALRRLRRGALPVDARLDLHGLTAERAHQELAAFLRTTRARGERCVLVIHGKGDHSPGGVGVLRGEIAAWLSQGSASDQVAAFATARPDDGGAGAVYVLLRR
jgi:DNA-nicking Smr family endonuclease